MSFRDPLPEHALRPLSDEELIAYVTAMRDHGHRDAAAQGLAVLVFGHWENMRRRVRLRVPVADVDDVTAEIITSAFRSAFDGTSEGEFLTWLGTIAKRRIADHHRKRARQIDAGSLDALVEIGHEPAVDGEIDQAGYREVQEIIAALLEEHSPAHRRVIQIMVDEDRPAADAVAEVDGITGPNAYKIVSRYRAELRLRLSARDTPEGAQ